MPADATLVLLHPVGLTGGAFFGLDLSALPGARTPDLLGHGSRPRSPGMTVADVADDVAASIEGPLDVAGFSFGGLVGFELALRHPDRVRSLLVACVTAIVDPAVMLGRAEAAEAGMVGVVATTLERWFTAGALAAKPDHPGVAYARATLEADDPHALADAWRAIAAVEVADRLDKIRVPVTCVAGEQDVASPAGEVEEMAAGIPGARFVLVRGPHMAVLEEPQLVGAALSEHLARAA